MTYLNCSLVTAYVQRNVIFTVEDFQDFRIAFHSEIFVGFIFDDLLQCWIMSQNMYLCIAKDIVYSVNQPAQ